MIGIVIATYGDGWVSQHRDMFYTALQSALSQTVPVDVVWEHGPTLAEARNRGARHVKGDRLVFLDADDRLFLDFAQYVTEDEDVLQPITMYVNSDGVSGVPHWIAPRENFLDGNHLIVGSPVKREVFMDVGGFDEWPVYEDWALWLKIWRAGGTFGRTTGIYVVQQHDRPSRNQSPLGAQTYEQIRNLYS